MREEASRQEWQLSKDYDFIALPENTWQEKRNEYHGQYQIGVKYPKLSPIVNSELRVLNITKETFDKERSEAIQKDEELFVYIVPPNCE